MKPDKNKDKGKGKGKGQGGSGEGDTLSAELQAQVDALEAQFAGLMTRLEALEQNQSTSTESPVTPETPSV